MRDGSDAPRFRHPESRGRTSEAGVKEKARRLVDALPENATRDDLMNAIYVRQAVEAGLADAAAGRATPAEDVRESFGLR